MIKYAIPPNVNKLPDVISDEIYEDILMEGDIVQTILGPLSKEEFIQLYEDGELKHWNMEKRNEI